MRDYRAESTRAGLESLAGAGLVLDEYMDEALTLIRRAVPADAACLATVDPASLMLSASHRHDLENSGGQDFFYYEYAVGEDVALFTDLARRPFGVSILHEETHGDPARSTRFANVVRPLIGAEHELRGVARRGDVTWGAFALYRTVGSPAFNAAEAEFMHRLQETLADGIRAGLATATVEAARAEEGPPSSSSTRTAGCSSRRMPRGSVSPDSTATSTGTSPRRSPPCSPGSCAARRARRACGRSTATASGTCSRRRGSATTTDGCCSTP